MWNQMLQLSADSAESLQNQIRTNFVKAILEGLIPGNYALPSSRELSRQLGVSRNTVMFAYQHLIDSGYLIARERRGYFVNPDILDGRVNSRQQGQSPLPLQMSIGLSNNCSANPQNSAILKRIAIGAVFPIPLSTVNWIRISFP